MNVLKKSDGLLTNSEVYELLTENKIKSQNRATNTTNPPTNSFGAPVLLQKDQIESQSLAYFNSLSYTLATENLHQCLKKIKALNLNLTEAEIVQIANHLPTLPVEIHTVSLKATIKHFGSYYHQLNHY